jgi:16S rRNA processing protein RimM
VSAGPVGPSSETPQPQEGLAADDAWVPLAEVARPHGIKGELRLKLYNQDSDILLDQDEVLLRSKEGVEKAVSVDRARRADGAILMKLHAVDDRNAADELRQAQVCVRRSGFPPLEEGEFYVCDVVGARVLMQDGEARVPLGTVRELRTYPSVEVLVIHADDGGKDWEIPLVGAFVESVDAKAHEVVVTSLEGLERG